MSSLHPDIDAGIAGLTSLERILAWMQANQLPHDRLDLVAQDEYCHDLFVPWRDQWIVFGLT
jgi:hypothetical protein